MLVDDCWLGFVSVVMGMTMYEHGLLAYFACKHGRALMMVVYADTWPFYINDVGEHL